MTPAEQQLERERQRAMREKLELTLIQQIKAEKLDAGMVREHRFHPTRKWRFDIAWPDKRRAVEIQGGIWIGGRHNRPQGMENDAEKLNEAQAMGWFVLVVTAKQIGSGQAIRWIKEMVR